MHEIRPSDKLILRVLKTSIIFLKFDSILYELNVHLQFYYLLRLKKFTK